MPTWTEVAGWLRANAAVANDSATASALLSLAAEAAKRDLPCEAEYRDRTCCRRHR